MSKQSGLALGLAMLIILLSMILLGYSLKQFEDKSLIKSRHNINALSINNLAKEEMLEIELQPVTELDFKSKAEVLKLRTEAVYKHSHLILGDYKPSEPIFGQMEDCAPWWGVLGMSYYGNGEKSIEGPSLQSISILNPYLLVVPDFYFGWSPAQVSIAEVGRAEYPTHCEPRSLRWYPKLKHAEAVYEASCARLSSNSAISLMAYNARDFNLNYIYVSYKDSRNIFKQNPPTEPYLNPQFIHRGSSCGYPGGCNNLSPSTPPIDNIKIINWPAQVVVWFWKDRPSSVEMPPDMTFIIKFE
ncbi:MAG: hypothetical protein M1147_10745 [Nitrospirae bacterium]|nr:hypothetical protein [Nitrospirota bacterium]MCL5978569.1 hypothetical protein [Nitrospirota bacterium]